MMRLLAIFLLLSQFLVAASNGWAQGGKDRVIELKGGARVVLRADGTMSHYDRAGLPVAMPEGVAMVAEDGGRIMMKSQALWREILELAATSYARANTFAIAAGGSKQRSLDLKDGGRIVLSADGTMAHYDAAGNRLGMADGEVMIGKDGSQILMVNGSLWSPELNGDASKAAR
jgi:ferric-dicitrate binding protein FerR (iron transport regulator)